MVRSCQKHNLTVQEGDVRNIWPTGAWKRCQKHDLPVHECSVRNITTAVHECSIRNITYRCMKAVSGTWHNGAWRRCQKHDLTEHEGGEKTWPTGTRRRSQKHDLPMHEGCVRNTTYRCMKAVSETLSSGAWRLYQKQDLPVHPGGVRNMTYRRMMAVSGWSWSSTPSIAPSPDHIADTGLMENTSDSTCLRDNHPYNLKYRGVFYTVLYYVVPLIIDYRL